MPDLASPRMSTGVLDEGSAAASSASPAVTAAGSAVTGLHLSKRPRDDGSPLRGKRGRGEHGDITLTLQSPMMANTASSGSVGGGCGGTCVPLVGSTPPLCESPSKVNHAACRASSPQNAFAPFGADDVIKSPCKVPGDVSNTVARRKGRVLPLPPPSAVAAPSLGATDPIFHAALLRLLHRRDGNRCHESPGWRWGGDTPARFDHWPCALHPSVMDLLACVSAGEERVVLTGCDVNERACRDDEGDDDDVNGERTQRQQLLAPPPTPREATWTAPLPRAPAPPRGAAFVASAPASPVAATPISYTAAGGESGSAVQTPMSALRRPGSTRRVRSSNRVRFSTHDMSVVDTPDPARGGSEAGMISALGGLDSILSAAEQVRALTARSRSSSSCSGGDVRSKTERGTGAQSGDSNFEGYFDRFSSAGKPEEDVGDAIVASGPVTETQEEADKERTNSCSNTDHLVEGTVDAHDGEHDATIVDDQEDAAATESRSVSEDALSFVDILEEIASSDSAPAELALPGGWAPEHRNAAAFYAKELASLCGVGVEVDAVVPSIAAGSHLRVRYLDVLSCLIRYNLKLLLNVCVCDVPEVDAMEDEAGEASENDAQDDSANAIASSDTEESVPSPPTNAHTIIVPGRTPTLRQQLATTFDDAAWESTPATDQTTRGCGCVTVLDGTGALEFNTEDVAALLTLALARVRPFMKLAARLAVTAEEDVGTIDEDGYEDLEDALNAKVWATVQQYAFERRAAVASAAEAVGAAPSAATTSEEAGACPTELFSDPTPMAIGECGEGARQAQGHTSDPTVELPEKDDDAGAGTEGGDNTDAAPINPAPVAPVTAAAEDQEDTTGLTVDEAADLLEYVAAARFIAQVFAEPVVAAGVALGRWEGTERLAKHVEKLAKAEEASAAAAPGRSVSDTGGEEAQRCAAAASTSVPSLSNMLCLEGLVDVQGLGVTMAQQARYAPALEAILKGELRRAMRRGQGSRQRRIKNRLQQAVPRGGGAGAPGVFSFPMITPCCYVLGTSLT